MSWFQVFAQLSALAILKGAMTASSVVCNTLNLLHVVPLQTALDDARDKGLEISPAGHLAARQINSHPQLLNGSKLEIIDVPSEPCGSTSYATYVDIMSRLSTSQQKCVFGVIGLYCSSVARTVATPLNNPQFGYIQLSSATSPLLQNAEIFPYLFRVVATNEIYGDAAIEIMLHLNWTKISVVYNFTDIIFRRTGQTFSDLVDSHSNLTTLAVISLPAKTEREIDLIFDEFSKKASRISFWSVSTEDSGMIMCEAYKRKLLWPWYAYIFADRSLEDVLAYNGSCSPDEMKRAAEGVIFLQKRMSVSSKTVLVSGQTFQEYKEEYRSALRRAADDAGISLEENEYANTLYDQVWSFALAMNISLNNINTAINNSFRDIVPKTVENRRALWKALYHVSFQGATGTIRFDNRQEVPTDIAIFQARSGIMVVVGEFETYDNTLTFYDNLSSHSVPSDSFDNVVYSIPIGVTAAIIIIQVVLLVFVLASVLALTYWRERAEVKSTSLHISYMMLVGDFLLSISLMLYTIIYVLDIPRQVYSIICNVDIWIFFLGVNLIVVCLLFRLLRIVYIFRSYRSIGKYCSDMYLTLYILLSCSIMVFILIVWEVVDPLHQVSETELQPTASPPQILEYRYCSSEKVGVWLGISHTWLSLLLVIVICLAILTRKIKRKNFKDTKKVYMFVFSIFITCTIFLPLYRILEQMNYILISFLLRNASHIIIILFSQVLLFLPKYVPILFDHPTKQKLTTLY